MPLRYQWWSICCGVVQGGAMPLTIALKLSERLIEHADFNEPQVWTTAGTAAKPHERRSMAAIGALA